MVDFIIGLVIKIYHKAILVHLGGGSRPPSTISVGTEDLIPCHTRLVDSRLKTSRDVQIVPASRLMVNFVNKSKEQL